MAVLPIPQLRGWPGGCPCGMPARHPAPPSYHGKEAMAEQTSDGDYDLRNTATWRRQQSHFAQMIHHFAHFRMVSVMRRRPVGGKEGWPYDRV